MKKSEITFFLLALALGMSVTSCDSDTSPSVETVMTTESSVNWIGDCPVIEMTIFCDDTVKMDVEISDGNDIRNLITSRTDCFMTLVENSKDISDTDEIVSMIDNRTLPDYLLISNYEYIESCTDSTFLGEKGKLVPWDEYIERYQNIRELYTDEEWEQFRYEDGHIYWANIFGRIYGEDRNPIHNDYAFWIQERVLEWDGYPEINTLDEYFDLLIRYAEANPTMPDGTEVIPYTTLSEDWRYYCIESAPNFLAGYADCGGGVSVNEDDPENPYVIDYNVTSTAKQYFQKLNEAYNAGFMDADFDTQTYEEYIAKLSTGRILGMADQYWDFAYAVDSVFDEQGLKELGCDYVPLALVMDEGQSSHYHLYADPVVVPDYGLAVTTSCKNPDMAFYFINELLSQDIHDLRFWGVEGVDYLVDENGLFYRTEEMRANWADPDYQKNHCCQYPFMPNWSGTSKDGINAMRPEEQTSEIYASVSEPLARCFEAYGSSGYVDMLKSDKDFRLGKWAPLIEFKSSNDSPADIAWNAMVDCKREWIPEVVKSANFESTWNQYMAAYNDCNPQAYLDYAQDLLDSRIGK